MNPSQNWSQIPQRASQESTEYDEALLIAARAGSQAAFAELQSIHSRRLYNRIRSITGNHEDAEDALQDTFFRAFRALSSFEGRSKFSSWLTRIAINSALMTIRRRRARPETSLEQPSTQADGGTSIEVADPALNPEEICDQEQRSRAILHAVERLNPKLRDPLHIWMSQEHSMRELAQHLGVSLASVKARLHRARKHLLRNRSLRNRRLEFTRSAGGRSTGRSRGSLQVDFTHGAVGSFMPRYRPFSESSSHHSESL